MKDKKKRLAGAMISLCDYCSNDCKCDDNILSVVECDKFKEKKKNEGKDR